MQLKRPLCVAVLLLCTGLFLVQLTGQKMAEALPKEKEQISLGGRLMQKEEKNGHLLLYLQQVQILSGAVAADASNTNNKNSNSKMGAVCYLQEGSLVQAPPLGSRVVVCGRVMYFAHAENEGQFDARAYYASLGYDFQLTNAELLKVSREADRLAEGLFRLREDAKAFLRHICGKKMRGSYQPWCWERKVRWIVISVCCFSGMESHIFWQSPVLRL